MGPYQFHEGGLRLAPGFVDQSVNCFSILVSDSELERQVINLTISRDSESPKTEAIAYANEQLVALARLLPHYELLAREPLVLLGQHTLVLDYQWVSDDERVVRQRQTYLRVPSHFLVLTMSFCPTQLELATRHWLDSLDSLRLE